MDLVINWMNAWNSKDIDRLINPIRKILNCIPGFQETFKGKQELQQHLLALFKYASHLTFTLIVCSMVCSFSPMFTGEAPMVRLRIQSPWLKTEKCCALKHISTNKMTLGTLQFL
jgi:hypothetical protein